MKTLRLFLETAASDQAARMGLQGDGHGDWYDPKTGALVAKTVKGRLKIFQGRQAAQQPDPKQQAAPQQQQQPADVDQLPAPPPIAGPNVSESGEVLEEDEE